LCRPHAHEEYHRDGERALKAAMKESQATDRWLGPKTVLGGIEDASGGDQTGEGERFPPDLVG
jgi:hypothetical protein